jgi:hypothetical protein
MLKKLFASKVIKIQVGDRVQHNTSKHRGTVLGTATINASIKIHAVTVRYDDGFEAVLIPGNEFTKIGVAS